MNQAADCFVQQDQQQQQHLTSMGYAQHSVDNHQPVIVGGPGSGAAVAVAAAAMGHPPEAPPHSSETVFAYPTYHPATPVDPGTPCNPQNIFNSYYYNGLHSPILDISSFWPPTWPFADVLFALIHYLSHSHHVRSNFR